MTLGCTAYREVIELVLVSTPHGIQQVVTFSNDANGLVGVIQEDAGITGLCRESSASSSSKMKGPDLT